MVSAGGARSWIEPEPLTQRARSRLKLIGPLRLAFSVRPHLWLAPRYSGVMIVSRPPRRDASAMQRPHVLNDDRNGHLVSTPGCENFGATKQADHEGMPRPTGLQRCSALARRSYAGSSSKWRGNFVILQIRVKPRSRVSELSPATDGTWIAKLKSPPVDGKANEELVNLVAEKFHCPKSAVSIKTGSTGRTKLVKVAGQ